MEPGLEVRQRIKRYYQRESYVVHPPVNTAFFTRGTNPTRDFFLTAGRLEPYKRFDLAIDACNKLGLPLVVAGVGTNQELLQKRAGPNIRFLGRVSDEELRDLYRNARAFIFPAFEDAGIMVLESLACGTPVIAYGQGGATEFIRPGLDGLLFPQQSGNSLASALEEFELLNFDPQRLAERASQFSCENFQIKIRAIIDSITGSRLSFNPNERLV